ncbi:hypothetical protein LEMLEM_LOCUS8983 [Lemmus lemmus]
MTWVSKMAQQAKVTTVTPGILRWIPGTHRTKDGTQGQHLHLADTTSGC